MLHHLSSDPKIRRQKVRMRPRIPCNRMNGENDTDPRICVAESVLGCLKGLYSYKTDRDYIQGPPDDDDLARIEPYPYTVYTVEAESVPPIGVPDAEHSGELWITRPVTLIRAGWIQVWDDGPLGLHWDYIPGRWRS